jgi:hypothetical protein
MFGSIDGVQHPDAVTAALCAHIDRVAPPKHG